MDAYLCVWMFADLDVDVHALKRGLFHAQVYDQIINELLVAGSCFLMRSLYGVRIRVTRVCLPGRSMQYPSTACPPLARILPRYHTVQ